MSAKVVHSYVYTQWSNCGATYSAFHASIVDFKAYMCAGTALTSVRAGQFVNFAPGMALAYRSFVLASLQYY